jgi:hypothetical protein
MNYENQEEREKEIERATETNVERDKRTKEHSELGFRLIKCCSPEAVEPW